MAKADSIQPFPADIDRDSFGHWLSGFCDGEAHFSLRMIKQKGKRFEQPCAFIRIALRDDDLPTLLAIQSYWGGCGSICFASNARSRIPNAKPYASYQVNGTRQLASVIVPHFDRYPMRAKKLMDFNIWKQGVVFMGKVQRRPDHYRRCQNSRRQPKWTPDEREHFLQLAKQLREQRAYNAATTTSQLISPQRDEPTLFD